LTSRQEDMVIPILESR